MYSMKLSFETKGQKTSKTKKILSQQSYTKRNTEGSYSERRKIIPSRNTEMQKGMKNSQKK